MSQTKTLDQAEWLTSFNGLTPIVTDAQGRVARVRFSPFAKFSLIIETTDLNDYTEPGVFAFTGLQNNAPCNMAGQLMLVWSHYPGYVFQVVFGFMWGDTNAIYFRRRDPTHNPIWVGWSKITGSPVST